MKSWTGQNSICSSKPSTRAFLIFCVFKLSLQSLYCCQNSCPLSVPDPLGWTGTCHRVTKHVKKTWEGSIFPVIKNNFSLIRRKSYVHSTSIACALYLPFSWRGKEGAQFQRRNGVAEKGGSWTPTYPAADAVLLQQEARTQVCCNDPLASLSSCCQLCCAFSMYLLWKELVCSQ